jgi:acyl-CoA synthetase (AMP-forming)/AMP-acid ligase II
MALSFVIDAFKRNASKDAIVWKGQIYTYQWLLDKISFWKVFLIEQAIAAGQVIALEADFSPDSIALFFSLIDYDCIIVPLTQSVESKKEEFVKVAEVQCSIELAADGSVSVVKRLMDSQHGFYQQLRKECAAGLVLFSSGSTGKSKAAVHKVSDLLEKFKVPRPAMRTIAFLLFDHIGGINTMLHVLINGGCLITVHDRDPNNVLNIIEKYHAELLPTSPTFLNLILLSEAYQGRTLNSLKLITYGTEPMQETTLQKLHGLYPHIKLSQTYGLSEVGILRAKSKSSESLWVKLGGEGFDIKIIENILYVKGKSTMLGYLNAASPFTEDGWFNTKDMVEVDGEYLRILGRDSDIINVGGEKVYPAEVESVILAFENVADVTVYSEKSMLVGNIVCAKVLLKQEEDNKIFIKKLKAYCKEKLQLYKVPVKIIISSETQHSGRFKKLRR